MEEIDEEFEGEWKNHDLDTLAGLDADGRIRAYARSTSRRGTSASSGRSSAGESTRSGAGGGSAASGARVVAGRGRQKLAESGKELPGRLASFADDDAAARRSTAARGRLHAGAVLLRDETAARRRRCPASRRRDGISIVPWSVELDERVRLAHNEAFADHWGSEPRTAAEWAQGRSMFAPTWSLVAIDDATGEVAGYLLSASSSRTGSCGYSAGYTDVLGVRRAWRGRRLAGALLSAAMAVYRADGIEYAELGVDTANPSGAHRLYANLGLRRVHSTTMYAIEL